MTESTITGKALGLKAVKGRFLTVKEVASFLRVSERWVYKHMEDGIFPVKWWPIGVRDRVVDSAALDEWLLKTGIDAATIPTLLPLKAKRKLKKKEVSA